MNHKKNSPDMRLAADLARHLLAPSDEFEDGDQREAEAAQDGFRCLSGLEKATQLSLPIVAAAPVAYAAPVTRPEYQPALSAPGLLEALLSYQGRTSGRGAGFVPARPPKVQAEAKPATPNTPRGMARVFRSRGSV